MQPCLFLQGGELVSQALDPHVRLLQFLAGSAHSLVVLLGVNLGIPQLLMETQKQWFEHRLSKTHCLIRDKQPHRRPLKAAVRILE